MIDAHPRLRTLVLLLSALSVVACSGGASSPDPSAGGVTSGGASSGGAGGLGTPGGMTAGGMAMGGLATGGAGVSGGGAAAQGGSAEAGSGGAAEDGGAGAGGASGSSGAGGGVSGGVAPVVAAQVRWFGRVDVSDPASIKLAWSASGFIGTFSGPSVSVKLGTAGSGDIYFQPVIDGAPGARFAVTGAEKAYEIAKNLGAGTHQIALYRESEGKGLPVSVFTGFAAGTPAAPPPFSGRLIEIVGDSISAGYGNLGVEQHPGGAADPNGGCEFETKTQSAYLAYGSVAARAVNADASVLAGSGFGIYSDYTGNTQGVMPALFGNTLGDQKTPAWSFNVEPQAVVVNLGTNDASAKNLTADKFKPAYAAFLDTVRSKYPNALILCAVGSMLSGADRTNALTYIDELVSARAAAGDRKVKRLDLGTQDATKGTGCSWHPNVAENARMAALLTAELETSLGW